MSLASLPMPASHSHADSDGPQRQKLLVGGLSACMLVAMVFGTAAFVLSDKVEEDDVALSQRTMSSTTRTVDLFCGPTDYQATCHDTLEGALDASADAAMHPHAAAAAAITAASDELARGFNRTSVLDIVRLSNDTRVREAVGDCRMLLEDCRDDIARALASVARRGVERSAHDLQAWLSAVVTFQGSCVDMFPEGEVRDKVKLAMRKAAEMSSNAIAIIQQGAALVSMLDLHANDTVKDRRLRESFPPWVSKVDRKLLGVGRGKKTLTPNVTVAKDGSGNFTTISAALGGMPETYQGRYVIYVKEGVYEETVNITEEMPNVTMYGDGSRKTIVTGSKNVADGVRTWRTATFAVDGDRFMAIGLGIRNTAGPEKRQAVALRVKADRSIFLNCRVEGHQDTLFAQAYRQFYRGCVISGTVDFIFGDSAAVFQRCVLLVRPPLPGQPAVVAAHGRRDRQQRTGFVVHRSQVIADNRLANASASARSYLGRPWKEYARTVVMESVIDGFVHGQGYMPWEGKDGLGTAYYGEYGNVGVGADVGDRSALQGFYVMGKDKAEQFTVGRFLHGADWIPETGTPVRLGLFA